MSKRVAIGLLGAFLAGTAPALAQTVAPGVFTPDMDPSRRNLQNMQKEFDSKRLQNDSGAASSGAAKIAECVARRAGASAGNYVGGAIAGDPDYARIGEALSSRYRNCTNGVSAATASAISNSLAQQLVLSQAPQLEDHVASVDADAAKRFYGDLSGPVTIDNVAGCLAAHSPGLTYKLLGTPQGSEAEKAALDTVYKQTPECGMQSAPAGFPVDYQRGVLATALYKWTHRG